MDKYPDMVKEIFARGHEIGNHSDTHPHMSQLSESAIKDELRIMSDKVEKLTGVRPTLFRPPYGDYNNRVVEVSRAEGYECVQWSIDSLDWKDRGTEDTSASLLLSSLLLKGLAAFDTPYSSVVTGRTVTFSSLYSSCPSAVA